MRITFVLSGGFDLSGGDRVISIYADRLQKRGHEVFVISRPLQAPTLKQQIRALLKGQGWIARSPNRASHFDNTTVPRVCLERHRPVVDADLPDADVVIATWWETAEWVANLSPSKGAKVHFVQHHEVFEYLAQDRVAAAYRLPLHKITISRWLVDIIRDVYGQNTVDLIPNSVNTAQFFAPPRGKQPTPTVGMLYSHVYWKGCDIGLQAFELARQQIPNLKLVAFGNYPLIPQLPLPQSASFTYAPAQDSIRDLYASCDVWMGCSRSEGFYLPFLEAMACRCPVVSTAVGGPKDAIEDGVNGYLVPVDDPEALADRLVKVLQSSEQEWRTMSEAAYTTATGYTWDDATDRLEAALIRAIAQQNGTPPFPDESFAIPSMNRLSHTPLDVPRPAGDADLHRAQLGHTSTA